mgnify:CR=1 FL=1
MYQCITEKVQEEDHLSIQRMCEILALSRIGYYRWKEEPEEGARDMELRDRIQRIALLYPYYGYRRITHELHRSYHMIVNHKKVLRLMREDNLLYLRKKKFIKTTNSDHSHTVYPNLIHELHLTGLNQLWLADITYIRLRYEFVYLAVILDAYSRRCIGWALDRYLDTNLTLSALHMALKSRSFEPGFVHHSDRGVQYASKEYTDLLKNHGMRISMGRKGNPYDNAKAESFIKTLKYEEVYLFEYANLNEARKRIDYFIGEVYNEKRLHSSLGYIPPVEFEEKVSQRMIA